MITLNSKNGKVAALRFNSFTFQYNPSFKSPQFKTKDDLKITFKQHRDTWNLEKGVDNLFKRVNEGYTVQFGVNTTSTQVNDIEYFDGFFIDYDGWDKKNDCPIEGIATIEEILALPFVKEHCLFYQLSFSNRPEALSVHLFFKFDKRTRDFKEHHLSTKLATKILTEQLGNRAGFDEAVSNNVGQVCFAGRGEAVVLNLEATPIDIEEFVEEAEELGIKPTAAIANRQAKRDGVEPPTKVSKPQAKILEPKKTQSQPQSVKTDNNSEYDDSGEGITNWALRRIQTDIIDGKLEGNWSAIYCLYDHEWKTSSRAIDAAAIAQLDGSNPFSSTNSSGGSFTITKYDNDLPPVFYDRSGNFEATDINGNLKSGGNILEYVFALEKTESGLPKYCKPEKNGKYIVDSKLIKKYFKDLVKSLYKFLGLKPLDFREFSKKKNDDGNEEESKIVKLIKLIKNKFGDSIRFNEMKLKTYLDDTPVNFDNIQAEFAYNHGISAPEKLLTNAVNFIAHENRFHPVKDYLESLLPCTNPRIIDNLATRFLGTESPLFDEYLKKTLVAAVRRIYDPGCKFDHVCVLQGRQGALKSTFWEALARNKSWFNDSLCTDSGDKDDKMKIRESWIHELSEIDGIFKRKEIRSLRSFITSTVDKLRPPYGRSVEEFPRMCIFVGTVNRKEFLNDPDGNRRFWVIPINVHKIDVDSLRECVDEIWSAALQLHKAGYQIHLSDEHEEQRRLVNTEYEETDAIEDAIFPLVTQYEEISTLAIAQLYLKIDPAKLVKSEQMRIAEIMTKAGWKREKRRYKDSIFPNKEYRIWVNPIKGGRCFSNIINQPWYGQTGLIANDLSTSPEEKAMSNFK